MIKLPKLKEKWTNKQAIIFIVCVTAGIWIINYLFTLGAKNNEQLVAVQSFFRFGWVALTGYIVNKKGGGSGAVLGFVALALLLIYFHASLGVAIIIWYLLVKYRK